MPEQSHSHSSPSPGSQEREPLISLCMIVKDEEQNLPRLLESVTPWVDEIIVVDTGSSDRSVEIAESYGARVYHHPWENDFAKHRNQSISYAKGKWILIMDADEELDQNTAPALRPFLESVSPEIHTIYLHMYNPLPGGQGSLMLHPRLFRNGLGFHYRGSVHNTPVTTGKATKVDVRFTHYGYNLDPETMERKHQRRVSMIRKWLEREPGNFLPHAYLAQALVSQPEHRAEAAEEARLALEIALAENQPIIDLPRCYYPLIASLCHLGRDEEAWRYAKECAERVPFYPDPWHFLSYLSYKHAKLEEVCRVSRRFVELQDRAKRHPEDFRFVENLTVNWMGQNLFRWIIAASVLKRDQEARECFQRLVEQEADPTWTRKTIEGLLSVERADLAQDFAELTLKTQPSWREWAAPLWEESREVSALRSVEELRRQGLAAAEAGEHGKAARLLERVIARSPQDAEVLVALGCSLKALGHSKQAISRLMQGLNANPLQTRGWRELAEIYFAQGRHDSALACYRRLATLEPGDRTAAARLEVLERRLAQQPGEPTVRQNPPRMVIFLCSGLSPQVVRQTAPTFLIRRAWGELEPVPGAGDRPADLPAWASLYTGLPPAGHGLEKEPNRQNPAGIKDLKALTLWELMAEHHRLGLMAAPLCVPPPDFATWAVAGHPAGLLEPSLVHPSRMAPLLLAAGYRSDYLLNRLQDQTGCAELQKSRAHQALLNHVERTRFLAVLDLPAVEVLVIGCNLLERLQPCFPRDEDRVFAAYQELYGWIESLLAFLRPDHYAILSQRGYGPGEEGPRGGGFYCLSWLQGENRSAGLGDPARAILERLGVDPARLGRPRN